MTVVIVVNEQIPIFGRSAVPVAVVWESFVQPSISETAVSLSIGLFCSEPKSF